MRSFQKSLVCVGLVLSFYAGTAQAKTNGISYNNVEIGYSKMTIDNGDVADVKLTGYHLQGSKLLSEKVFFNTSFSKTSDSGTIGARVGSGYLTGRFDVDYTVLELGLGFRHQVSAGIDFVTGFNFVKADVKFDFEFPSIAGDIINEDATGFSAQAGFRYAFNPSLEIAAAVDHVKLSDSSGKTGTTAFARFYLSQQLAFKASVAVTSDTTTYGVSVGYHF